jgi:hypothetical protein
MRPALRSTPRDAPSSSPHVPPIPRFLAGSVAIRALHSWLYRSEHPLGKSGISCGRRESSKSRGRRSRGTERGCRRQCSSLHSQIVGMTGSTPLPSGRDLRATNSITGPVRLLPMLVGSQKQPCSISRLVRQQNDPLDRTRILPEGGNTADRARGRRPCILQEPRVHVQSLCLSLSF